MPEYLDSRRQEGAGSLLYLNLDFCSGASDPPISGPGIYPEVINEKMV